jgi:hypothetical protein
VTKIQMIFFAYWLLGSIVFTTKTTIKKCSFFSGHLILVS